MQSPTPDSHDRETHDAEATHDGGGISEFEQLLKQKTFTRKVFLTLHYNFFFPCLLVNGILRLLSSNTNIINQGRV